MYSPTMIPHYLQDIIWITSEAFKDHWYIIWPQVPHYSCTYFLIKSELLYTLHFSVSVYLYMALLCSRLPFTETERHHILQSPAHSPSPSGRFCWLCLFQTLKKHLLSLMIIWYSVNSRVCMRGLCIWMQVSSLPSQAGNCYLKKCISLIFKYLYHPTGYFLISSLVIMIIVLFVLFFWRFIY